MTDIVIISRMESASEILETVCLSLPELSTHEQIKAAIIETFAGQRVYFPHYMRHRKRDQEIAEKFDGRNIMVLCREYRLSCSQIRRIINRMRIFARLGRTCA